MRPLTCYVLCVALTALALPARAQMIDEGSFTLKVNGERVGREQFSIRRNPVAGGSTIIAKATVSIGPRTLTPMLKADSTGQLQTYGLEIRVNGRVETQLRGDVVGGRYTQDAPTSVGQSHKELRLAPGTALLDDDVIHQFYFVARERGKGRLQIYVPQRLTRDSLSIVVRGQDSVDVLNGRVPATHLVVTNGAGAVTDLWVDASDRVLRVAIAARHFEAVRDEAPR